MTVPTPEAEPTAAQVVIVLEWRERMIALTMAAMDELERSGCDDETMRQLLSRGVA